MADDNEMSEKTKQERYRQEDEMARGEVPTRIANQQPGTRSSRKPKSKKTLGAVILSAAKNLTSAQESSATLDSSLRSE